MGRHVEVPLRWGDLDAQGHVNNARFIDYLQEARADFLLGGPHGGCRTIVAAEFVKRFRADIRHQREPYPG